MWTPRPWPDRVGQRVDQAVHERSLGRHDVHVLAAARVDRERLASQHPRHLVRIQAAGVDHRPRENRLALGADDDAVRAAVGAEESRARQERDARVRARREQRLHELFRVHDAGDGRPDGRRAGDVGLARDHERAIDELQVLDAVGHTLGVQRVQRLQLRIIVRDDQLPAARVRDAVARAEVVQQAASFDAQPCLERSGRVVDAGVNDAAVVRARVLPGPGMAFEHADRAVPAAPALALTPAR